jgi:hypothetical protein
VACSDAGVVTREPGSTVGVGTQFPELTCAAGGGGETLAGQQPPQQPPQQPVLRNAALQQKVTFSSQAQSNLKNLVAGTRGGSWASGECASTGNSADGEWWQVDLGAELPVSRVDIYHRTDCCQERMFGAEVRLSSSPDASADGTTCGVVQAWSPGVNQVVDGMTSPEQIACAGSPVARYVTVSSTSLGFNLCEVEVMVPELLQFANLALFKPATVSLPLQRRGGREFARTPWLSPWSLPPYTVCVEHFGGHLTYRPCLVLTPTAEKSLDHRSRPLQPATQCTPSSTASV